MKYLIALLACAVTMLPVICYGQEFQLIIEPVWRNLEQNDAQAKRFGGKWVLACSITFRKKAKQEVNLTRLYLHWKGAPLDYLLGSLYRKCPDKEFMPIEESLVCDGSWNKIQQTLRLTFDQKESLGLSTIFYLVLTVPEQLEHLVRQGSFEIVKQALPEPFRLVTAEKNLSFTLDALDTTLHSIVP